jgi:hypothetical protein
MTTIVTRAGKGSALSFSEMDANFSNLNNDKAETGGLPSFLARAWVNFNGTGTVAIRASGNVSSITDGGTGTYTVNFTTAMPDTNYITVNESLPGWLTGSGIFDLFGASGYVKTTAGFEIYSAVGTLSSNSISLQDCENAFVAVFR